MCENPAPATALVTAQMQKDYDDGKHEVMEGGEEGEEEGKEVNEDGVEDVIEGEEGEEEGEEE